MSHTSPFKFSLSFNHAFVLYTLGIMCYFKFGGIEVHLVRICTNFLNFLCEYLCCYVEIS
jgi:hypothetical protein